MDERFSASPDVVAPPAPRLNIAYAIQNVGGIQFHSDVGDTVPVKQSLLGLHRLGHKVRVYHLKKTQVLERTPPDFAGGIPVTSGFSDSTLFRIIERISRRLGRDLRLRYYATADSYRFYTTCLERLPHFDLCHEHNGLFGVGAAAACRRLGLPYVLTFSADLFLERELVGKALKGLHRRVAERQARFTYDQARAILCVSAAAKKHLIEQWAVPEEKIHIMPNGVDIELFKPLPSTGDLPDPIRREGIAPRIIFVGGFQPWHGLDILIESFARVRSAMPEARLLLVGDGRARSSVDRSIAAHGLEKAVKITGYVPQDQIPRWLSAADIAVLPYPRLPKELWFSPLKLYEYMASGKAIVASRAGQIAEVIKDGYNGVLTPPGDVEALADVLLDLLRDPDRRRLLGRRAREQAEKQHSWDQYVRRLEAIYRQLLTD